MQTRSAKRREAAVASQPDETPIKTTTSTVEHIKEVVEEELTVLWEHIQAWQRDNQFILSGYRPMSNSYKKSAASLGYLHNESVNIWTHLLGAVFFLGASLVLFRELKDRYQAASQTDLLVFGAFFLGAVVCLAMSATFHTISNHSQIVQKWGNKLDYLGIVALICGSFIPSIYYGFACEPTLITTYWTMITTIGAGCAVVSWSSKFATSAWRPFRAGMFVAMGLSAIFPVIHGLRLYGVRHMVDLIALPWLVSQGVLYVLGASIYAARIPERLSPGTFDIFGSSHQIFHCLVVAAAMVHLKGLINAFDYHHQTPAAYRCLI